MTRGAFRIEKTMRSLHGRSHATSSAHALQGRNLSGSLSASLCLPHQQSLSRRGKTNRKRQVIWKKKSRCAVPLLPVFSVNELASNNQPFKKNKIFSADTGTPRLSCPKEEETRCCIAFWYSFNSPQAFLAALREFHVIQLVVEPQRTPP